MSPQILLTWGFNGYTEDFEQTLPANPTSRSYNDCDIPHSASENDKLLLIHKDFKSCSKYEVNTDY